MTLRCLESDKVVEAWTILCQISELWSLYSWLNAINQNCNKPLIVLPYKLCTILIMLYLEEKNLPGKYYVLWITFSL